MRGTTLLSAMASLPATRQGACSPARRCCGSCRQPPCLPAAAAASRRRGWPTTGRPPLATPLSWPHASRAAPPALRRALAAHLQGLARRQRRRGGRRRASATRRRRPHPRLSCLRSRSSPQQHSRRRLQSRRRRLPRLRRRAPCASCRPRRGRATVLRRLWQPAPAAPAAARRSVAARAGPLLRATATPLTATPQTERDGATTAADFCRRSLPAVLDRVVFWWAGARAGTSAHSL